jgi:hypothetical protein
MIYMVNPERDSFDIDVLVDDHLVDELVRYGVPRGHRVHMHLELRRNQVARPGPGSVSEPSTSPWPPPWFASFDGAADLGVSAGDIVRRELGQE